MKDDALLAFIPDHLAAVNRTAAVLMYRDAYSAFWHTVSAGYMLAVVRRTARALLSVGLGRGSRVIILSENRPECFYTSFAAYRIGAVNVPLMSDMSAEGVAEALRATGARLIMAGSQQAYDAALAACRLVRRHIRIVTFSRSVKPVRSDRTTVTFAAFTEPFRAAGLSIAPPRAATRRTSSSPAVRRAIPRAQSSPTPCMRLRSGTTAGGCPMSGDGMCWSTCR